MSTGLKKTIVLAVTGLAATLGSTSVASACPVEYAALGDSYSSGNGAGSYVDDTACERSANAYPELYAKQSGATLDFQACSGATVADVLNNQLAALGSATTLVSITVGGNDAGFTDVMANCILGGDAACKTATDTAVDYVHDTLPGQLDGVYSAIRDKAPNAKVVVVGYPHIYFPGDNFCNGGVSNTSRGYVNGAADALDTVLAAEAANAGFAFADVRGGFTGHEVCSDTPWLNTLTDPLSDSFHPNVTGHAEGYLPAFTAAL